MIQIPPVPTKSIATPTGDLADAEAIYDGANGNLVGIKTFAGGAPQHGVMFGMSGAGKSVNMIDLLTQTDPYYDYTVIVEEGLSYGIYTQTVADEAEPIIILFVVPSLPKTRRPQPS